MSNFQEAREHYLDMSSLEEMSATAIIKKSDKLSRTAEVSIADMMVESLLLDDPHSAAASAFAFIEIGGDNALVAMRRLGVFRASRYHFGEPVARVVGAIVAALPTLGLGEYMASYVQSLAALHILRGEVHEMYEALRDALKDRREVVLKTLLVAIEKAFLGGWKGGDNHLPGSDPLHYGIEDLAEGLSFVLAIMRQESDWTPMQWARADAKGLLEKDTIYLSILVTACRINQYRRAETLLDVLPFSAAIDGRDVRVFSSDPILEKSLRLGYVQHEHQVLVRRMGLADLYRKDKNRFDSLHEAVDEVFKNGMSRFVERLDNPESRLVFKIPGGVGLEELLRHDQPFLEEIFALMQLDVDSFSDESVWMDEVHEGMRVMDIMRVQRLFAFISQIFEQALSAITSDEERGFLAAQSKIMVMPEARFKSLLAMVLSPQHVDAMIDLLALPEQGELIDLQYAPLIVAGGHFVVAPSLLAGSNLIRNARVMQRLYKGWDLGDDPMVLMLKEALSAAGFLVAIEVNFPFGEQLDGDVVALKDGALFVFECKHPYHPCNAHELRNVYDHIVKAGDQLSLRIPPLNQTANHKALLKALGWEGEVVHSVHGAIVTATRVFHGWNLGGFPVVQVKELMNVVGKGIINGPDGYFQFWKGDVFAVDDLSDYLDGGTLLRDQLECMNPHEERHPFGDRNLLFDTWMYQPEKSAERYRQNYRFTPRTSSAG